MDTAFRFRPMLDLDDRFREIRNHAIVNMPLYLLVIIYYRRIAHSSRAGSPGGGNKPPFCAGA